MGWPRFPKSVKYWASAFFLFFPSFAFPERLMYLSITGKTPWDAGNGFWGCGLFLFPQAWRGGMVGPVVSRNLVYKAFCIYHFYHLLIFQGGFLFVTIASERESGLLFSSTPEEQPFPKSPLWAI